MPVRADVAFGLAMKNVNCVEPFSGMLAGPSSCGLANGFRTCAGPDRSPKLFWIVGGDTTVTLALEVLPAPPSVEVTVTLLFCAPAAMPVTFSDSAHDPLTAKVAPDKLTEVLPGTAVSVPPHVLVTPLGVDTTSPAGRVSVKATLVSGIVFKAGLTNANDSDVEPFIGMLAAPNVLVIAGGAATVKLAVAVLPVPPLVDATVPVVLV